VLRFFYKLRTSGARHLAQLRTLRAELKTPEHTVRPRMSGAADGDASSAGHSQAWNVTTVVCLCRGHVFCAHNSPGLHSLGSVDQAVTSFRMLQAAKAGKKMLCRTTSMKMRALYNKDIKSTQEKIEREHMVLSNDCVCIFFSSDVLTSHNGTSEQEREEHDFVHHLAHLEHAEMQFVEDELGLKHDTVTEDAEGSFYSILLRRFCPCALHVARTLASLSASHDWNGYASL
jgi:hypothetical protein